MVAQAKEVNIRVQAVIGMQTTEVKMLKDFMADVTALTGGEVTFEVLPAGAVVGVKAGGIGIANVDNVRQNTDRITPSFRRDRFRNPPGYSGSDYEFK